VHVDIDDSCIGERNPDLNKTISKEIKSDVKRAAKNQVSLLVPRRYYGPERLADFNLKLIAEPRS
jgi:hypothetical protein